MDWTEVYEKRMKPAIFEVRSLWQVRVLLLHKTVMQEKGEQMSSVIQY